MKFINIFLICLLSVSSVFAEGLPVVADSLGNAMLTCPKNNDYGICGGINAKLHNDFNTMMKKKDAVSAIRIWDQMVSSTDGSNSDSLDKYIANPLIGSLAPEGILPMPSRIFAKKAYKGGILYLGTIGIQDSDFSFYYVGFMRYKKEGGNDMMYYYNNQIAPNQSSQYNTYGKVYGENDFTSFEEDLKNSFYRGKFNNSNVNTIFQKMIRSVR